MLAIPPFLISIAVKLLQWGLEKLFPIIKKAYKSAVRNAKMSKKTNKEVAKVKEAIKEAEAVLAENDKLEKEGRRVPPAQEKKLREATKNLSDSLFS